MLQQTGLENLRPTDYWYNNVPSLGLILFVLNIFIDFPTSTTYVKEAQ